MQLINCDKKSGYYNSSQVTCKEFDRTDKKLMKAFKL